MSTAELPIPLFFLNLTTLRKEQVEAKRAFTLLTTMRLKGSKTFAEQ